MRKDQEMSRTLPIFLLALGTLAASKPASAQQLGTRGDAIFGAERLFGVRGENFTAELPDPLDTLDVSQTTIGFGFADRLTPFNIPRVGFDYMIINKLSVGGAIGFSTSSASIEGGAADTNPTLFMIAPRAGFLHMFGKVAGIWPRGGFTYHSQSGDPGDYSESGFSINVECNFPIVFTEHFGVLLGVSFDRTLTANRDPDNTVDFDISYQSFGLQVGLFGWI
jgi:hypothetical protein